MRRISHLAASLLLYSLFAPTDSNVLAELPPSPVSRRRPEPSLAHTIFHGSDRGYGTTLSTLAGDAVNKRATVIRKPDDARYAWKYKIGTTVFWIGEQATEENPVPNTQSAWDLDWVSHYGGYDDPIERTNFIPAGFTPQQNPFYVALPYDDVTEQHTRPEAALVIPWFRNSIVRDGQSVCKGRWLAIRHGNRTCYAQWEDVGPFQSDHWQYVFGNERPAGQRKNAAATQLNELNSTRPVCQLMPRSQPPFQLGAVSSSPQKLPRVW